MRFSIVFLFIAALLASGCSDLEEKEGLQLPQKTKKRGISVKDSPPIEEFPQGEFVKMYDSGKKHFESIVGIFPIPMNGKYFKGAIIPYLIMPYDGMVRVSARIYRERTELLVKRYYGADEPEIIETSLKNDNIHEVSFQVKKGNKLTFGNKQEFDADDKARFEELKKIGRELDWSNVEISHLVVELAKTNIAN